MKKVQVAMDGYKPRISVASCRRAEATKMIKTSSLTKAGCLKNSSEDEFFDNMMNEIAKEMQKGSYTWQKLALLVSPTEGLLSNDRIFSGKTARSQWQIVTADLIAGLAGRK